MTTAASGAAPAPDGWPGPLAGIRVLDLSRVLAGPFVTQLLGDLGAEILKIETPGHGDDTRTFPPHLGGESHYFMALNRQKKSLVIDLAKPAGAQILRDLVARADVLVENYRPGVMQRLGLDYASLAAINPRLIYCAVSGFGLSGPLRDKPSFDIVTQAMSGMLSVNGEKGGTPVKLGVPLGDLTGGIFGSIGILSALHERHATGRGRLVDISLHDGMLAMLGYLAQLYFIGGKDPQPVGTSHPSVVPYGAFPASDGQIIIACLTQAFWGRLCEALGCPQWTDDPRFNSTAQRLANRVEVDAMIGAVTRTRTVAEWAEALTRADVPNAPVLGVGAALNHPHSQAREMVVTAVHPRVGPIRMVGRPIKFPGQAQAPLAPPPLLGEHTRDVLARELGFDAETLERLTRDGVIDRIDAGAGRG
ncbi:MAG: CoA transferase [Burkholderiales bacterium]|nr:CoA transferase [Burkholderiales bacterium]